MNELHPTGSVNHPASYSMGIGVWLPCRKAVDMWGWQIASTSWWG